MTDQAKTVKDIEAEVAPVRVGGTMFRIPRQTLGRKPAEDVAKAE